MRTERSFILESVKWHLTRRQKWAAMWMVIFWDYDPGTACRYARYMKGG